MRLISRIAPKSIDGKNHTTLLQRWRGNRSGTTAVEFAMVSIPLLMFVFATFGISMHFFTTTALEHAVDVAARKLRTGQAQASAMTNAQFKQEICNSGFLDCNKVEVHLSSNDAWSGVSVANCVDGNGDLTASSGASGSPVGDQAGCAGRAFVVTACYEFELAKLIPLLDVGAMGNGAGLIQASSAGRAEPHQFECTP